MKKADRCEVSFAIACYNALPYLDSAIDSALSQTDTTVELLVVDDHSDDASKARAEEWRRRDPRVRVFQTEINSGPGAARNVAIANMRGEWFAVLDSDDLLAHGRTRKLVDVANSTKADLIADDLILFGDDMDNCRFLPPSLAPQGGWIDPEMYFGSTIMFGSRPNLGFLKPMIRKSALDATGIRYNSDLRIAEDDELIVRLLLARQRYYLWPKAGYHYRKHGKSISHRLSHANAEKMLQSEQDIKQQVETAGLASSAYLERFRSIQRAEAFTRSIEALKAGRPLAAISPLILNPSAIRHYTMPLSARIGRILGRG